MVLSETLQVDVESLRRSGEGGRSLFREVSAIATLLTTFLFIGLSFWLAVSGDANLHAPEASNCFLRR